MQSASVKWLWVRISFLSLKLLIWRLLWARSSLTFRQTIGCGFTLKLVHHTIIPYNYLHYIIFLKLYWPHLSFLYSSSRGTILEIITDYCLTSGSWLELKCPEIFAQEICWRIGRLSRHVVSKRLDWNLSVLVLCILPCQLSLPEEKVLLSQYICDW